MEEVDVDVRGETGVGYKEFKMKRKVSSRPPTLSLQNITGVLLLCLINGALVNAQFGGTHSTSTANPITSDSATCQCGVFLLGTGTLTFSADAKPVLAGLPVAANCSASDDKISCATICRQLIQAMSGNQENTPLVQTVVLAATRTLACQRFNDSHKVPAPRNFEGTSRQTLAQLDDQKNWKFFVGPSQHGARSDLASESPVGSTIDNNDNGEHDEENIAGLTDPKWLGGYYRWCDEHWIYAGVSLHEPLCCQGHVPKKCPNYHPPTTKPSARNGRRPRLIVIKRCPNNVCEDEEEDELEASSGESNNNKASPTSITRPSLDDGEDETEAPETKDKEEDADEEEQSQKDADADDGSSETINPYTTPAPAPSKPLNATVMSEALKFFETLMEGLGYGDVFEGVRSVLPETHAVQLLERINHGGWLTNYQDRYIKWPREFSLGYCYLEYSMYNVKTEGGLVPATQSLLERVFGPERPLPPIGARLPQALPSSQPMPSQNPYDSGLASELTNYIQPIPQMNSNSFGSYDQYEHSRLPGNRRVKRGVSVARSYSGSSPAARVMERRERINNLRDNLRNNRPRRVRPVSRNVPFLATNDNTRLSEVLANSDFNATQVDLRQYVPLRTLQPSHISDVSHTDHNGRSSFVPTYTDANNGNANIASSGNSQKVLPKVVYRNNVPYTYDPSQATTPVRRSHVGSDNNNGNANLAEIARPRRHPGGQETIEDKKSSSGHGSSTYSQRGPMGPQAQHHYAPPPSQRNQPPTPKDGPSAGNLLNIASMLMQTAMAQGGGGGGNNDGDKVTNMMQTAIPLVAQVANNPAVHNMVNNLVTTFLTPPNSNGPPPPPPHRPSRPEEPESDEWGLSSSSSNISGNKRPSKNPIRDSDELNSNEIEEAEISSSNSKPVNARPPPNNGGGASEMIASMVQNMVSSYIKHLFSPGRPGRPQRPMQKPGSSSGSNTVDKVSVDKPSSNDAAESNDIVDVIANAAKPFFISTFGVVPGDPGYGRLLNRRRDEFKRHGGTSKGHNPNDILTEDPDPGTGIFDIIVGPPNFPDTGNKMYDFGNRVVYGFTNANDPHHGVYCFKQYFVNKVWDYFRLGIRAVFK